MTAILGHAVVWTFVGALAVLVIINADKFATATTAVGNFWVQETKVLTGSGYTLPRQP